MSTVYIGTSGWQYMDWQGKFYPENLSAKDWLEYYSQHFKTVEVNSTFYHQMRPSTAVSWSDKVPGDFVFAVKANRFITHMKRLLDCTDPLERLLEQLKGLGENLGPVLFQLPPRWGVDQERLEDFLSELTLRQAQGDAEQSRSVRSQNSELKTVFEFRDESWFTDKIFNILKHYNSGLVINDSPNFPKTNAITANFTYIRFHGPSALYSSEYSDLELEVWAKKIKDWLKSKISVFAYFNNDVGGFAVKNAKTLISKVLG